MASTCFKRTDGNILHRNGPVDAAPYCGLWAVQRSAQISAVIDWKFPF
jgi:hypothetical protein